MPSGMLVSQFEVLAQFLSIPKLTIASTWLVIESLFLNKIWSYLYSKCCSEVAFIYTHQFLDNWFIGYRVITL